MATTPATPQSNPNDQYYTRPETVAACLAFLDTVLPDLSPDLYLEPSAGDGAFLQQMPHPRLGIDIAPAHPEVVRADFFTWVPDEGIGSITVIGNPPFGRNGAKATASFNHAAPFADLIAMIMPASMSKGAMQNRLDPWFELVAEMPLPAEPFRAGDKMHKVNAVFQIWKRCDVLRPKAITTTTHADFAFVATPQEADFAIRRVGSRAGAIMTLPAPGQPTSGYAPTSNLFIKARGIDPARLEARFRALDFSEVRLCAVSNPSVSKNDIVTLYDASSRLEAITTAGAQARQLPSTTPGRPVCPIMPVGQLHGGSLARHLKAILALPEVAHPGDIVAVRCSGLVYDNDWMTAETTFLVQTVIGVVEYRLSELDGDQFVQAAMCAGLIDDDWELVSYFPDACHCPVGADPRRYEVTHYRNAALLLWVDAYRCYGAAPVLLADAKMPAALLIAQDDLTGPTALAESRLTAIKSLAGRVGLLEVLDPKSTTGQPEEDMP